MHLVCRNLPKEKLVEKQDMSEKAISTREPLDKDCTGIVQSVPRAQMEQKAGVRTPWEG